MQYRLALDIAPGSSSMMGNMSEQLQIGEVADLFNISTKTLRHYEKLGLLEAERTENGYRLFSAEHVLRIQRIRNLQMLGLSLRRIKSLLDRDSGEPAWDALLQELLEETESELATLERRREHLEQLLDSEIDALDPIIVARPPDDARLNAYLATYLPQEAIASHDHDKMIYGMLQSDWAHSSQLPDEMQVGYAGSVPTEFSLSSIPFQSSCG